MRSRGSLWVISGSMLILPSMYQSTIWGTCGAAAHPAEGRALPDPARHQLEGPGFDLLTRAGDADDDAFAPAAMAAFQRLAHQIHIADALETVIGAAFGQFDQIGHQIAFHLFGIDEMGHAKGPRQSPRARD